MYPPLHMTHDIKYVDAYVDAQIHIYHTYKKDTRIYIHTHVVSQPIEIVSHVPLFYTVFFSFLHRAIRAVHGGGADASRGAPGGILQGGEVPWNLLSFEGSLQRARLWGRITAAAETFLSS